MKKFIIKTVFFLVLPVLIYLSAYKILKFNLEKKISNHSVLILGDSQSEYLNLPNSFNYSINGSAYFVHYSFVKEFENVIHDKKIYLAINYHNLSNLYENRLRNDSLLPGWAESNIKGINDYNILNSRFEGINEDDRKLELTDLKGKIIRLTKKSLLTKSKKNSFNKVKDTTTISSAIYRHWQNPKYIQQDEIQHAYLDKLINLLLLNDNEVILLKMPVTNYYFNNVPNNIKSEIEKLPKKYNIKLLDLHNLLQLQNNYNLFKDYGHLNAKGDSIVMDYFLNYEMDIQK